MYKKYLEAIQNLQNSFPSMIETIGYSTMNEPIYKIHVGNYGKRRIVLEGGIHAREYISSLFLVELAKSNLIKNIDLNVTIFPCINPDGFRLVAENLSWISDPKRREILKIINNGSDDFSKWKANINGVDLNTNFNVLWGHGKHNLTNLNSENYIGNYPESEKEIKIIKAAISTENPILCLSYHSKGEVIFYGFDGNTEEENYRDYILAYYLSKTNNYTLIKNEKSTGGLSDWVSKNFKIPDITIEVGSDTLSHPIGTENLSKIFEKNKDVLLLIEEYLNKKDNTI